MDIYLYLIESGMLTRGVFSISIDRVHPQRLNLGSQMPNSQMPARHLGI